MRKSEQLSLPFKKALQAYLRHKYSRTNDQKRLAELVDRPFSTVSGFIYNGIGGHELQYSLLAISLGLDNAAAVESFLQEKQALFLAQTPQLPPSVKLFFDLFNDIEEELLCFFIQAAALNIKLAQEFNFEKIKKKPNKPTN